MIDREYIFTLLPTKKDLPQGEVFFSVYQAFAFFTFTAWGSFLWL